MHAQVFDRQVVTLPRLRHNVAQVATTLNELARSLRRYCIASQDAGLLVLHASSGQWVGRVPDFDVEELVDNHIRAIIRTLSGGGWRAGRVSCDFIIHCIWSLPVIV